MSANQATILSELLKMKENMQCCDCTNKNPRWASTTFGTFICIRCAGFHRQLGTSITKVRSVNLDKWTPEMIELYRNMNNIIANAYWEKNLPSEAEKPNENTSNSKFFQFINNKYVKKKFVPSGMVDPATEFWMRRKGEAVEAKDEHPHIKEREDNNKTDSSKEETEPKIRESKAFNEILIPGLDEFQEAPSKPINPPTEKIDLLLSLENSNPPIGEIQMNKKSLSVGINLDQLKCIYESNPAQKGSQNTQQKLPLGFGPFHSNSNQHMEPIKPTTFHSNGYPKLEVPKPSNVFVPSQQPPKVDVPMKKEEIGGFDVNDFLSSMKTQPPKVTTGVKSSNAVKCFDDIPTNW